jgi:tetratricopeptide (TPR) repeat protein
MILGVSLFVANIALADNNELTELESQQLKILKLSKVVEGQPSTIELKVDLENYKMGLEFYQQADYQQAISELLKVEYSTLNLPLYIKSQYLLGDCYRKIEDWNRAIEIYKNLVIDDPILTDYSLFHLAETYRLKGENRESTTTYKQITENFPQSLIISEVNYQIAQNYRELNDTTSAVIYYKNIRLKRRCYLSFLRYTGRGKNMSILLTVYMRYWMKVIDLKGNQNRKSCWLDIFIRFRKI